MKISITFETDDEYLLDSLAAAAQYNEGITLHTGGGTDFVENIKVEADHGSIVYRWPSGQ